MPFTLKKYFQDFFHLLFPNICLQCGSEELHDLNILCNTCIQELPYTDFFSIKDNVVEKMFWGRISLSASGAALFFTKKSIVQILFFELKYKNNAKAGWLLGKIMGDELLKSNRFGHINVLVPVPIQSARLRKRGYNQALLLCEGIASVCGWPILNKAIKKLKNTSTQTHKDRLQRGSQAMMHFELCHPQTLHGMHLLVIDDVVTTGATMEALGHCLLTAQPASIGFAAAAYTLH
ncbi:MAG: ComF family protein [Chitinophagia bacterium]|nr:ComF family protein [Chitinophagia bacterium]